MVDVMKARRSTTHRPSVRALAALGPSASATGDAEESMAAVVMRSAAGGIGPGEPAARRGSTAPCAFCFWVAKSTKARMAFS